MTFDTPYHPSSLALTLEAHAEADAIERAALEAMRPRVLPELENTIDIDQLTLERLMDGKWLARLQTIGPQEFGRLSPVERRVLLGRAKRFAKRFREIENWMTDATEREPAVPEFLRAKGAA